MNSSVTRRIEKLKNHLSYQFVDFDQNTTTERLHSLYNDFSKLKILNPYGYEANVNYWRAVLLDCNIHGYLTTKEYCCFIDKNEISELFYRPKKGKPLCLTNVITEMIETTHELTTQREYEKRYPIDIRPTGLSWLQWLYTKPLRWLIPETPEHLFVVIPTVQEYARIIVHIHYQKPLCSSLDNLFTFEEFKHQYDTITYGSSSISLGDMDIWMILRYLHHENGVDLIDTVKTFGSSSTVIKFPDRNEAQLIKAKITENDKAVINLRTACSTLHRQVEELQMKSEEFFKSAKDHLGNKRRPQAIYLLKKKKQVDDILDRRLNTLETMETMLLKIEASQNDLQVVEAFNLGADTLRQLLDNKTLDTENISETIDKLKDTLQDQKQVEEAITIGQNAITAVDDEELEQELNALQHQQQQKLTQPINTESELLRLQNLLSSLNHPCKNKIRTTELAS